MHADHSKICKLDNADSLASDLVLSTIAMELERSLAETETS